jgi:hypothetical protein
MTFSGYGHSCGGYHVDKVGCGCFNGGNGYRSREETIIQPVSLEKLAKLPESLQTEVLHYIEFVIEKQAKNSTQEKPTKKRRVAGTMKGMFVLPLPDDFDEPLDDMKEYRCRTCKKA